MSVRQGFSRNGTVKTILLLRHAKSAWGSPDLTDHDRPLNRRGERAAKAMAQYMADHCPRPDLILCSTATRTRQTLAPLLKRLEAPAPPVALENGLYLASDAALLARLRALPEDVGTVLLIGHNEGIGLLASALAGSGPPDLLRAVHEKYPTGALAVLRAPIDRWRELAAGAAELRAAELQAFVRPRDLVEA
ncbi:MAG: histidine phosphatase family protein [Proteobacteria bacterium]|nr:histidine phosphatase family protein [Pseudomonadota bacterium]